MDIIKTMRERISKLEEEKETKESEIESLVEEWKDIAEGMYKTLNDDNNVESDFYDDLTQLASEIQELKSSLKDLMEEIAEAKILDEWYIGEAYVSAIENGDFSGLDDDEIEDVQDFANKIADYSPNFCLIWGEESEFKRCHISGLRSSCLLAKLVLVG